MHGNAFEMVDASCMMVSPTSYQADLTQCGITTKERAVTSVVTPTSTPTSTPAACNYTLSMASKNFAAAGGMIA